MRAKLSKVVLKNLVKLLEIILVGVNLLIRIGRLSLRIKSVTKMLIDNSSDSMLHNQLVD